jgi:hypothetical protein
MDGPGNGDNVQTSSALRLALAPSPTIPKHNPWLTNPGHKAGALSC